MLIQENVLNKNDCVLNNFKLINKEEIISFLNKHIGLLELIEKAYLLIKKYFPKYPLGLEYYEDPESYNLKDISLYIYADYDFFDRDFKILDYVDEEIDNMEISNPNVKLYFSVDLFYMD